MYLLLLAIAPSLVILLFVWSKDKYDKEPKRLLLKLFLLGMLSTVFAIILELILIPDSLPKGDLIFELYEAFIGIALVEEASKYVMLYLATRKNKAFNQYYDGIVYAVFVSLGFATLENIGYVLDGGAGIGIVRALVSVPGHAIFGIAMGYYYSQAHFLKKSGLPYKKAAFLTILIPTILHGIFDFILITHLTLLLLAFLPFVFLLFRFGFKRIKEYAKQADIIISDQVQQQVEE